MTTSLSTLMCHAPIVVPAVGGVRGAQSARTTAAMRAAAAVVVARRPDVVVVLSPHTPRLHDAFSVVIGPRLLGDFSAFGAPGVVVDLPADLEAARAIARAAQAEGVAVDGIRLPQLDHGALVPLFFLVEAGWLGPTVVIGLPAVSSAETQAALGRALARASGDGRWAVVASGDCSHRLIPGAPSGFHPDAHRFDATLQAVVAASDDRALAMLDPDLRALAAEDVVDTVVIAAAAAGFQARGREVLSYEGPYGVGYLVAILDDASVVADGPSPPSPDGLDDPADPVVSDSASAASVLVDVAIDALVAHQTGRPRAQFDTTTIDDSQVTGCFVTWRKHGQLRGCIGTMHLRTPLVDAVAGLAVAAAVDDGRFGPVTPGELPVLRAEVSLLRPSQAVASINELDPAVWGVEVSRGSRRGVLLPGIEGITTVDEQLRVVLAKAGIAPHEGFTLRKFKTDKVTQPMGGHDGRWNQHP